MPSRVPERLRTEEKSRLKTGLQDEILPHVGDILESYANRGVFRGFSRGPADSGRATFKLLWHRDRFFELILDLRRKTLRFPLVLPDVPPGMYLEFKAFLESRHSAELPEHRRIDPGKARVASANRGGKVSVTMQVLDGDYAYATRKFIHLVHEIFMVFLIDGPYYEYMVEAFDLDPDRM